MNRSSKIPNPRLHNKKIINIKQKNGIFLFFGVVEDQEEDQCLRGLWGHHFTSR
jgi:hypothetical protein